MMAREASLPGGSFFDDEPLPKPKAKAASKSRGFNVVRNGGGGVVFEVPSVHTSGGSLCTFQTSKLMQNLFGFIFIYIYISLIQFRYRLGRI